MTTAQTVIDRARLRLQDAAKAEHTDNNLLVFYNEAQQEVLAARPDWAVGSYATITDLALGGTVPFPELAVPVLIDLIVSKAQGRDSEATSDNRMSYFQQLAGSKR